MATVGQVLSSPETGTTRHTTDFNSVIIKLGSWTDFAYSAGVGGGYEFNFSGSDTLTILTNTYNDCATGIQVWIDGVLEGTYTSYGSGSFAIDVVLASITGLSLDEHYCKVVVTDKGGTAYGYFYDRGVDLKTGGTLKPYNDKTFATVGEQLTTPIVGMTRYDNTDSNITYVGTGWVTGANGSAYNGSHKASTTNTDAIRFNFTGPEITLIAQRDGARPAGAADILKIDGVSYSYTEYGATQWQTVVFTKTDLSDGEHWLEITCPSASTSGLYFTLDAVDIAGVLKPYNENITPTTPAYSYVI